MGMAGLRPLVAKQMIAWSFKAGVLCAALGMAGTYAAANTPVLVADINKSGVESAIKASTQSGSMVVFALERGGKHYLYKTNGTGETTLEIKEIPGTARHLVVLGNTSYFVVGNQVWASDGTAGGTRAVFTGTIDSPGFSHANGETFFFAKAPDATAVSLWKTTGPSNDAQMVHTFAPTWTFSHALGHGSNIYFRGNDNSLWVSDGSGAGTKALRTFSNISNLVEYDGKVLFSAVDAGRGDVWTTDGTEIGTVIHIPMGAAQNQQSGVILATVDGVLYGNTWFFKLWKYTPQDGVTYPSISLSNYSILGMQNLNDKLKLTIQYEKPPIGFPPIPMTVTEAFIWEGTPGSIRALNSYDSPEKTRVGNRYFYSTFTPPSTYQTYVDEANGTRAAVNLLPEHQNPSVQFIGATADERALFLFDDMLYKTDGTAAGTQSYMDLKPATLSSSPFQLTPAGDTMFFSIVGDLQGALGLWRTDGTALGTTRVVTLQVGHTLMAGQSDGSAYYITDAFNYGLWKTNGTAAGTVQIDSSDLIYWLATNGSEAYYHSNNALWKTNGAAGNKTKITDLPGAALNGYEHNGFVYFYYANYQAGEFSLYKTNGTEAGTTVVKGVRPSRYQSLGNELYFSVESGPNSGLYKTDGTPAGTVRQLTDADIQQLGVHKGELYFCKWITGNNSVSLYRTDGTVGGTTLIGSTPPGSWVSNSCKMYILNDELYMSPNGYGGDLYKLDEADNTLKHVSITGSTPGNYAVFKNAFFFSQDSPKYGKELFKLQFLAPSAATGWNLFQ